MARFMCMCVAIAQATDNDALSLLQIQAVTKHNSITFDDGICDTNPVLQLKQPTYSNLGGKGPDSGEKGVLYPNAGIINGVSVDIKMTSIGPYQPFSNAANGIAGSLGRVNLAIGTSSTFQFAIVESGTDNPVEVTGMSITYLDVDEGKRGKGRSTVSACGVTTALTNSTELTSKVEGDCVTLSSSKKGSAKDNPTSTTDLTDVQLAKIATFNYGAGSTFRSTLSLAPKGRTGRSLNFAFEPVIPCVVKPVVVAKNDEPILIKDGARCLHFDEDEGKGVGGRKALGGCPNCEKGRLGPYPPEKGCPDCEKEATPNDCAALVLEDPECISKGFDFSKENNGLCMCGTTLAACLDFHPHGWFKVYQAVKPTVVEAPKKKAKAILMKANSRCLHFDEEEGKGVGGRKALGGCPNCEKGRLGPYPPSKGCPDCEKEATPDDCAALVLEDPECISKGFDFSKENNGLCMCGTTLAACQDFREHGWFNAYTAITE